MYDYFDSAALVSDHEGNQNIDPEKELNAPSTSDNAADTPSSQKMTAFSMFEHFRKHTRHAIIDGVFHLYNEIEKCYRPLDKQGLESYLLDQYYNEVSQTGSLRIIKTCAELIMRKDTLKVSSADKHTELCFKTGHIPLADINHATFVPYLENDPPSSFIFSTYTINAAPAPCVGSWNIMKALPTPKMDDFVYEIANGNQPSFAL